MFIEEKFVGKYKDQFYSGNLQTQQLVKQQKQLLKILEDLNTKTQKYFDKLCSNLEKKNISSRNSFNKQNTKLPILVAEAEIKNSKTYRHLLQNEKDRLQKRIVISINLKQKDINKEIKQEKQRVLTMIKKNKFDQLQIKKLGEKLMEQKFPLKQTYQSLINELKTKKQENKQKSDKLQKNQIKLGQLKQKISQIDYQIQQNQTASGQHIISQDQEKLQAQHKSLLYKIQKIKLNIQSINKRFSQQYYCKLKQMESIVKKGEHLDTDVGNIQQKIVQKNKQIAGNNSKLAD